MAFIIAEELGVENFDEKNLKMCCPFHNENTASFVWNRKNLNFHCFGACGRSYDIIDILMHKGLTYLQATQKLFELAGISYSFGTMGVKTEHSYKYPKEVPINDKKKITEYLGLRKIPLDIINYCDVREDEKGNIAFQYYDLNDVLSVVKYRPSRKVTKDENKNWAQAGADTMPLLWNMNRINTESDLLICEGEIDCMSAITAGFQNAVSVPFGSGSMGWIEHNNEWLDQFKCIIICADNDSAGLKMKKEATRRLGSWRCKVVNIPETFVLDSGKKVSINDINEYLYWAGKEAVLDAILHAQDSPVPSLVDFSNIEEHDLSEMDGIFTGYEEIDKELYKLFFGSFNVVSGLPGAGKTSFLYGLVANAIDQDINCWIFSRELPNWMSKSWLLHILAGRRNHAEVVGKDGRAYHNVTAEAKTKMNNHYANKLFFYRDDFPNDVESLKESMESAVRKYNCRFFVLDNLMMISLGENENNKNEIQTRFINWLIEFCVKYQVCTILCCHPNKTQDYSQNVGMYQIAGTSNIINLAHRAIGLRRITKKEKEGYTEGKVEHPPIKYDVVLSNIKDRFTGKSSNEYHYFYDEVDRRFFSNQNEYDKNYLWDKKTYTEPLISEKLINEDDEIYGKIKAEKSDSSA